MSFSSMKKNSASSFDKLNKELQKINQGGFSKDDRLWSCAPDKAGNGNAVIRFLPTPPQDVGESGEDGFPFVRLWSHGFKGPGGWYIENSLTTLGKDDPVGEWNTELWNNGGEAGKKRVTGEGRENPGTKRQLSYYSNIYVVNDPANPENNGKVFLFKYGKKLYDKINEAMYPDPTDDVEAFDPFNLWTGANFRLKLRRKDGYANFDSSLFETPAPLSEDDDELEAIWNKQYSLAELVAPDKFKTYDELKNKLNKVLGKGTQAPSKLAIDEDEDDTPPFKAGGAPQFKEKAAPSIPASSDDSDDDDLQWFKDLAEND